MKPQTIIVDLDGTLCNFEHRRKLFKEKKFDEFHGRCIDDTPYAWCKFLIWALWAHEHVVHFVTARPARFGPQTMMWLDKHLGPGNYHLLMRDDDDHRQDSLVKEDLYEKHIKPEFDVLFCVDDRKRVVDHWRSMGLVCLQCAKGDY